MTFTADRRQIGEKAIIKLLMYYINTSTTPSLLLQRFKDVGILWAEFQQRADISAVSPAFVARRVD